MRSNRDMIMLVLLSWIASACSGCSWGAPPVGENPATGLNTTLSGVGVVFAASKDIDLPYTTMGLFRQHVVAGTLLKGTYVKQTAKTWKGDILWKLCGKPVGEGLQQEVIIADVSWKNGMIQGAYDGLSPVPSTMPPFMAFAHGNVDLSKASGADLELSTNDDDWIIRYYAYKELIRRKNVTPELRAILEKGSEDPVNIVSQAASGGVWDLFLSKDFFRPAGK